TVPTLEGYSFKGYYSAAEGGVKYYNMQGKPVVKWDIDSDATLYAQWMADGQCAPGTYYNETTGSVEPCPAKSYCPGGTWSTEGGNNCAIEKCPVSYPNSVEGASEEGQCYVEKTACTCLVDEATCSAKDANDCVYSYHLFNGVEYLANPGVCVAAPNSSDKTYCAISHVNCKSGSYYTIKNDMLNGVCELCSSLSDGTYTRSGPFTKYYPSSSENGETACYKRVNLPCTPPVCPLSSRGTCGEYDKNDVVGNGGFKFFGVDAVYPGTASAYVCPNNSFTCFEGYDKNAAADIDPSDGSASEPEDLCTPHVYTFTLDGNGADTPNVQIYEKYNTGWFSNANATNTISRVAIPVRTYYTFAGYYTKPTALEGGVQVIKESGEILDKPDVAADTTLYAWWRVNTYTVVYDANGGTGSMANVKHTCTEPKNLSKNAFTSATNNREFLGWARNSTATTPEFTDGAQVVNLTADDNAKVTLYAVWKDCTKCAAGTGAVCKLTAPVGVCVYDTSCSANYENLQNDGKYNPTCSAIKYGLTYETNGGVISSSFNKVTECTVESGAIVLPTEEQMTKADYRFDGWYDNNA
ncbi:MAG: InlB B-repeat-containing protein, partial [Alphaproteobacteria bacterium]|nr:InlB B-repeat-containing protein [Alphaproteobacteria bacterium]